MGLENENNTEKIFDRDTPLIPESFDVQVNSWSEGPWTDKKFITVRLQTVKGRLDILLWPSEANCLMDMIKRSLDGVDLSYDMEQAYKDLTKAE